MTSAPRALQWRRRALALALLLATLLAVTSSARIHGWLVALLPAAEDLMRAYPVAGASVFVAYAALSAMLAFVSGAVIVPVGVYVWGKTASLTLAEGFVDRDVRLVAAIGLAVIALSTGTLAVLHRGGSGHAPEPVSRGRA